MEHSVVKTFCLSKLAGAGELTLNGQTSNQQSKVLLETKFYICLGKLFFRVTSTCRTEAEDPKKIELTTRCLNFIFLS
jgi:hypothetical protein